MKTALILVVEPDAALREVLHDLLEYWGMRAEVTATVTEAHALVERGRPAGVILNLWPTTGDTIAFVRHVKGLGGRASVPVIALCDGVDHAQARDAREAGADAIVEVPFELTDLETRVRRLVRGAGRFGPGETSPPAEQPSRVPGIIAGGAEHLLHPLGLSLYRNRAWAHHERELSRRLRARTGRTRELSVRLCGVAGELQARLNRDRGALEAAPAF